MNGHNRTLGTLLVVLLATVAGGGVAAADGIDAGAIDAGANDVTATTQSDCSYPVTLTDATGTEVTLEAPPERIVALQPSDAQIVWSLNASDRVVGMTQGRTTAYLNDTEGITGVKFNGTTNVEAVTNLSADLILAANITRTATVEQLRSTDTPVYHFGQVSSMNETYRNINRTGRLIGNCEAAGTVVASMQERLDNIQRAVEDVEEPRVLYSFFGFVAGNNTHLNSMIEIAGGNNVAAQAGISGYKEINQEVVTAQSPQWIVQPSTALAPSGEGFNSTIAVQQGQVFKVNANYANQAGPRVVRVVQTMAQTFHPKAFDESGDPIVPTATPIATDTPTDAVSSPDGTTTVNLSADTTDVDMNSANLTGPNATTSQGSGPGFTPVVVLFALIGAVAALGAYRKGV